ncbi:MAG: magnesium/cobalt transporter CorA [Deltaproteobacteria bacterium]|nr:magnesium/cobalt transporter CorA [Deltaproteobacteria bacterium]
MDQLHRRVPPGSPPGTLAPDPEASRPEIRVFAYGPERLLEQVLTDPAELGAILAAWPMVWVDVDGLGDAHVISEIGKVFGLHPLAIEDVISGHQRAKVEPYGEHFFVVARMAMYEEALYTEQVSLFLGQNFVVTFQEIPGDCLEPVRIRLRKGSGQIRSSGSSYLAYALLDAIVDGYFPVLERYSERLENLEDEVVSQPSAHVVPRIHQAKRDLLHLRRSIWPLRESLNSLVRDPTELISEHTRVHLRDCYDHTVQIIDLVETYREIGSGLLDVYLSSISNRTNDVMKVLTIISTIFIPLTFIAGVYGMNFDRSRSPFSMPELGWYWGYPACLGLMAIIAAGLVAFFWRKGWIGGGGRPEEADRETEATNRSPAEEARRRNV